EIRSGENPYKSRIFSGENGQRRCAFRVVLVMTASIALRISQLFSVRGENARKTGKNDMKF
ncbi:MAG: hypothetical protein IJS72_00775, partial [Oscillospiraceae bacterium]|nr:hypothetical protein [Oscillospiraceae bacterium]